jgi:hypothetical protein
MEPALPEDYSLTRISIRLCEDINRAMAVLSTMKERTVRVTHVPE